MGIGGPNGLYLLLSCKLKGLESEMLQTFHFLLFAFQGVKNYLVKPAD